MSDQPAGTEEVTRWATTRLELTEALRQAQAGRLYVTDSFEAADALLEHLTPLPGESAAVPEPVMVLLEDAWALISVTGDGGDPMRYETWTEKAAAWRQRYESVVRAHAAAPARVAAGEQVTVSRSDLSSILAAAWGMTGDAGAFNRLAEACGLVTP